MNSTSKICLGISIYIAVICTLIIIWQVIGFQVRSIDSDTISVRISDTLPEGAVQISVNDSILTVTPCSTINEITIHRDSTLLLTTENHDTIRISLKPHEKSPPSSPEELPPQSQASAPRTRCSTQPEQRTGSLTRPMPRLTPSGPPTMSQAPPSPTAASPEPTSGRTSIEGQAKPRPAWRRTMCSHINSKTFSKRPILMSMTLISESGKKHQFIGKTHTNTMKNGISFGRPIRTPQKKMFFSGSSRTTMNITNR